MKKSWEITTGKRTDYFDIHPDKVIAGHHYGTGMTDIAGVATHEEFLQGRFQSLLEDAFGGELLDEMIAAVEAYRGDW